jgi:hypothetical protein
MKILSTIVASAAILLLSTIVDLGCGPPRSPAGGADAGSSGPGLCTRLEGVTDNQTIIAICATVEEIAYVVSVLGPILGRETDAGACTQIPSTKVCATPLQMGRGIQAVLEKRRGLLLLDAGTRRDAAP